MTNHFLTKAPTEDGVESDAHMSLGCLTRLRRGLHMRLASIVTPQTNSKHLCRLHLVLSR